MRKILLHLSVFIAVVIFFGYLGYKLLPRGYIKHIDVTEPVSIDSLNQRYIYSYSNDIGDSLAEKQRIPLFFIIYTIFVVSTLPATGYIKIKIVLLFAFSLIAYTVTTVKLLGFINKNKNGNYKKYLIPATLGGLYYITNYWFTNRIMHFGLFFSTVTVPIIFYLLYTFLYSQKIYYKKIVLLALLLAVFTATPHTILFEALIGITLLATFTVNKNYSLKNKVTKITALTIFVGLFMLANAYWLLPFATSKTIPDAVPSKTMLELLSEKTTLKNVLRLNGYWFVQDEDDYYQTIIGPTALYKNFVAYVPFAVILLIGVFYKKRRNFTIPLIVLFLVSLVFATSTKITNELFFWIMFNSPFKTIGWAFREPDKFGLLPSFIYALGLSFVFSNKTSNLLKSLSILLYILIITSNMGFLELTLNRYYNPQNIPSEFFTVNEILKEDPQDFNVVWYPGIERTTWSNTKGVKYFFTKMISAKPSITTRSDVSNYIEYIFDKENIYSIDLSDALGRVGVKYLIIRDDNLDETNENVNEMLVGQKGLVKIHENSILTVYKNIGFEDLSNVYKQRLMTNNGLAVLKTKNDLKNTLVDYTDKPSHMDSIATTYDIKRNNTNDALLYKYQDRFIYPYEYATIKENGNLGNWTLGSLENITHAEVQFFFNNLGLDIDQFDFGNGIVIARDGWQKNSKFSFPEPRIIPYFSRYENVNFNGHTLKYAPLSENYKYHWNTIRSDKFYAKDMTAIGIKLDSHIDEKLTPHFKLTTYDKNRRVLDITFFYPNSKGEIDQIAKVGKQAYLADFSIWTLSTNYSYKYSLSNVKISDMSSNVKPVEFKFKNPNPCTSQACYAFVRVLRSNLGGKIQIDIDDNHLELDTRNNEIANRSEYYEWVSLGKVTDLSNTLSIKLINLSGFNSINAILLLNESEYMNYIKNMESPLPDEALTNTNQPFTTTKQITPDRYEVTISNSDGKNGILSFAKPFSENWVMNGKPAKVTNGNTNGWELSTVENGTYYIEYAPQRNFILGGKISIISAGILLIFYLIPGRGSKSQGKSFSARSSSLV